MVGVTPNIDKVRSVSDDHDNKAVPHTAHRCEQNLLIEHYKWTYKDLK